jgi:integrase
MAWLFQDPKTKKKVGEKKCPWSVGYYDPEGVRRERKIGAKSRAEKFRQKVEGQLASGTYEGENRKNWADFLRVFRSRIVASMERGTRLETEGAIKHFNRIVKPVKMKSLTSTAFAEYTAARRLEPKSKGNEQRVSVATVNKELRHLRAIVRKAHRWGWLPKVPEIDFLKEPGKIPVYVPPEHFDAIYQQADTARLPVGLPYPAGDWWRALLVFAYMTGWRIAAILALRREDLDLEAGTAFSRHTDTKGKREQLVPLNPVVLDHLRKLPSFSPTVFPWEGSPSQLRQVYWEIQQAAGVKPVGSKKRYGFHDLRRGFASMNADRMTPDALQTLMQHKSYTTTQRYIALARQLAPAVQSLFVPAAARAKSV